MEKKASLFWQKQHKNYASIDDLLFSLPFTLFSLEK